MAIGERIRFIRNLRGMTQKWLGIAVGFPEKTADIRMAQYESGTRTPKEDLVKTLSGVLEVSPLALGVPDIDSEQGLMHTLFALEDLYGLRVDTMDEDVCLRLDKGKSASASLSEMLTTWAEQAEKYKCGEITKEEYDQWRYNYPKFDTTGDFHKLPSQELSDVMMDVFKDKLKDM
ncbi:MAG TPA: transcriptional regulator [Lachnospiraceae bacterium]|nr:transcriptional regulator [Lachnospiraceae bacterium]HBY70847.1 transcriptional regulator [Lachnospiraceae bacterium]HCR39664.1 transcriptional regulator [Lachnospiraceae bacterium]